MKIANYEDKSRIVDILSKAFTDNQSVNYVVKQDKKKLKRIHYLMDYSFDVCWNWGEVFITEDKRGAALIVLPHKKVTNLKAILLDLKLALKTVGLFRVAKVLSRESTIKKHHPKSPFFYLWFIGVAPEDQNNGIGCSLLKDIVAESDLRKYPIYLETSTLRNLPLYERFGINTYNKIDLGYTLYMMKREPA